MFWPVILRQWHLQQPSPHYVMSFAVQSSDNLSWVWGLGSAQARKSWRLVPDSQESYGQTLSWRLFALWSSPGLLPIKILTCHTEHQCWHLLGQPSSGKCLTFWATIHTPTLRFLVIIFLELVVRRARSQD